MKTYLLDSETYPLDPAFVELLEETGVRPQHLTMPGQYGDVASTIRDKCGGIVCMPAMWDDLRCVKIVEEIGHLPTPFETVAVGHTPSAPSLAAAFNSGLTAFLETPVEEERMRLTLSRATDRLRAKIEQIEKGRLLDRYRAGDIEHAFSPTALMRDQLLGRAMMEFSRREGPFADGSIRVLLVCTSSYQRKQMDALLKKIGATVVEAESLAEGLGRIEKDEFSLIISDNVLPDGDAVTFARTIAKTVKTMIPHFIVWSASPEKVAALLSPGNQVNDVIIKPGPDLGIESTLPTIVAAVYKTRE